MSNISEYLSPIGGIALPSYRIPIIIAAVGYGPLVLLASYKAQHRDKRTVINVGATIFAIERLILLSLHAIASTNPDWRGSIALAKYTEISLSLAYIVIANDAISLLRRARAKQGSGGCLMDVKEAARKGLAVAGVLGILAGGFFRFDLEWPGPTGRLILALRCASGGLALLFTITIGLAAGWSYKNQPHVHRRPLEIVLSLAFLTAAVAIYRLGISSNTIGTLRFSSLEQSIARQTLTSVSNSAAAGPLFLVFHLLPEWMSIALLIGTNLRKEIESGDYRQAPSTDIPV